MLSEDIPGLRKQTVCASGFQKLHLVAMRSQAGNNRGGPRLKGCAPGDTQDTLDTRKTSLGCSRANHSTSNPFYFSFLLLSCLTCGHHWESLCSRRLQLLGFPAVSSGNVCQSRSRFLSGAARLSPCSQDDLADTTAALSLCCTSW